MQPLSTDIIIENASLIWSPQKPPTTQQVWNHSYNYTDFSDFDTVLSAYFFNIFTTETGLIEPCN